MNVRPKIKADPKARKKLEIQIKPILFAILSGFLKFINLHCRNFRDVKSNPKLL